MSIRTKIIIALSVLIVFILAALIYLVLSTDDQPTPEVISSATPTATASPSLLPSGPYEENIQDAEALAPVYSNVPKITRYWTVEVTKDPQDGKPVLTATIYVRGDQRAEPVVTAQRQYIESWLSSIGQQPGTYVLEIKTEAPHTY